MSTQLRLLPGSSSPPQPSAPDAGPTDPSPRRRPGPRVGRPRRSDSRRISARTKHAGRRGVAEARRVLEAATDTGLRRAG